MTGEEMERAIEFLLQSQANSEARQEKTDQQIAQTNERLELSAETQTELLQTVLRFIESQDAINTGTRQRLGELTEAQNRTQQQISKLAELQQHNDEKFAVLAGAQLRTDEKFAVLAEMQQSTQQEISELTKTVNNLIKFSSGNGNSRQE